MFIVLHQSYNRLGCMNERDALKRPSKQRIVGHDVVESCLPLNDHHIGFFGLCINAATHMMSKLMALLFYLV